MRPAQATQGATMIVVVLLTLLLLSAVLAASLRLGLSSRQNTADQAATLRAQYQAESSLALVRSRLYDVQRLLSGESIFIPTTMSGPQLKTLAEQFCGNSTWKSTGKEFSQPRHVNDDQTYASAQQCQVSLGQANQFAVLATVVRAKAYELLPVSERPGNTDAASVMQWWSNNLNQPKSFGQTNYQLNALRAVKLDDNTYRFYFGLDSLQAGSAQGTVARYLNANRSQNGDWWIELKVPNLLEHLLMTNHHHQRGETQANVNFTTQVFDGSVFTNENFLFHNTATTWFKDKVESAGCQDLPEVGKAPGGNCTRVANVSVSGRNYRQTEGSAEEQNAALREKLPNGVRQNADKPINFAGQYLALPENTTDQQKMAKEGGLELLDNAGIHLFAGDANGNPLTQYDTGKRAWREPEPSYQYILMYKSDGQTIDAARSYRLDKEQNLYQFDPQAGDWKALGRKFNGMIYGAEIKKVTGPSRLGGDSSGDLAKAPPALASFAQMTLTAEKDVMVETDLTMSSTPCNYEETKGGRCEKSPDPQNVLGIYSQSGDIKLSTKTPNNLNLHAALMTSSGEITADQYNQRPVQGKVNLIGSAIMNYYGAFGIVGSSGTSLHGYSRNFSHDQRFLRGITPPGFPISPSWKITDAGTAGKRLNDLIWKQGTRP